MEPDAQIAEDLRNIRSGMHLRWNPRGRLVKPGSFDGSGKMKDDAVFEPRWELWDIDPQGHEYIIMCVQNVDGSFRHPGTWLVTRMQKLNPARYGGDVEKMLKAMMDEPDILREIGTEKDSDDLIEQVSKWADWVATPKSAAALSFRGSKEKSA